MPGRGRLVERPFAARCAAPRAGSGQHFGFVVRVTSVSAWLRTLVFGRSTPASAGWLRTLSGVSPFGIVHSVSPVFMSMAVMRPYRAA